MLKFTLICGYTHKRFFFFDKMQFLIKLDLLNKIHLTCAFLYGHGVNIAIRQTGGDNSHPAVNYLYFLVTSHMLHVFITFENAVEDIVVEKYCL